MTEEYAVELENITKKFGNITANNYINLRVKRGELMTLLGPSGCGKTTLLRSISGSLTPDSGRILIDGKDVIGVPTHQRDLGMVFQTFALFPHMTVYGNVEFPLKVRGIAKKNRKRMIEEALEMVRLGEYEKHYPRQLSGGQQQRVGLARALISRPKILLMDEPLSNLDAKLREQMRFEIRELQTELGITTLYVTHDQEEALALSDRLAIMNQGELHQVGTPAEIYERPETKFVADFIGLANFIRGTVSRLDGAGRATVSFESEDIELIVPLSRDLTEGEKLLILIRPHDVELLASTEDTQDNILKGTVTRVVYLGEKTDYRVKVGKHLEMRVQAGGIGKFKKGKSVIVHLPPDKCKVIRERVRET